MALQAISSLKPPVSDLKFNGHKQPSLVRQTKRPPKLSSDRLWEVVTYEKPGHRGLNFEYLHVVIAETEAFCQCSSKRITFQTEGRKMRRLP